MWFVLGISSGLFDALMGMTSKKTLRESNPCLTAFAWALFSLPFLFFSLLWLKLAPLNFTFWYATLISAVLSVMAMILFMRALSVGELSLTVPFLAFTPLFLVFTSNLMLGEFPSPVGISGILLIVAGTYLLGLKEEKGILGPLRAILKNKGAQLMLVVAFIFAISSNFNKIAILNSNPITYIIWVQIISVLIFIPLIYFKSRQDFAKIKSKWRYLLPIGLLAALTFLCQMTAFSLTIVPYVVALKRTSALFSVILGSVIFKERNIKPKLLGAALMTAGVLLISMS